MTSAHATSPETHSPVQTWLPVALAALGVGGLLFVGANAATILPFIIHPNAELDTRIRYQLITLVMTLVFLVILYRLRPANFRAFARLGNLRANPSPVTLLGIKASDTWLQVGRSFAIIITIATAVFIYMGVLNNQLPLEQLLTVLPWAVLLSVSNAFVEESLTRFGVVVSLYGRVPNKVIFWTAALIFGIPHYFGVPGGPVGALMAGFLGWLLAKSLVETRGIFWAWFIHFLQDVVILSALLAVSL
jgi:membrane protease YdiL (CAAX protease family)